MAIPVGIIPLSKPIIIRYNNIYQFKNAQKDASELRATITNMPPI